MRSLSVLTKRVVLPGGSNLIRLTKSIAAPKRISRTPTAAAVHLKEEVERGLDLCLNKSDHSSRVPQPDKVKYAWRIEAELANRWTSSPSTTQSLNMSHMSQVKLASINLPDGRSRAR